MLDCKTPQKTLEGIFKNAAVFSEGKCNRRHFQKTPPKVTNAGILLSALEAFGGIFLYAF
jgi:hypothetical protein